jgi:glycosyltransferase involved in cell wall biosynthesis
VVVSQAQRTKLAGLYDMDTESIHVIPPGIDLGRLDSWTDLTRRIVEQLELLQADALLLLPARLTRRKNIEFGLQVLSELRRLNSKDVRLLITGPPGPHNPANVAYLEQLLALRSSLGLENAAHFLYQLGEDDPLNIDEITMGNLFSICDALFFPSLDEGFGIPLLEARLSRMPIFCSDIAALRESGDANAHYFDPQSQPKEVAADLADRLLSDPLIISRAEVRRSYSWPVIVADKLVPLLEGLDDV